MLEASFPCCCGHWRTFAGGDALAVAPLLWDFPRTVVLPQDSAVLCIPAETAQHPVDIYFSLYCSLHKIITKWFVLRFMGLKWMRKA